jgi:hypothetical protein
VQVEAAPVTGEWFRIQEDAPSHAGQWHLAGWMHTAIKTEDLSLRGGAQDRTRGWLSLAICPRCRALVIADEKHAYGDQQWAHEDWHHRTDYPHPEEES